MLLQSVRALGLSSDAQQRRSLHVAAALHVSLNQFAAAGRESRDEQAGQIAGVDRPVTDPHQAFDLRVSQNKANERRLTQHQVVIGKVMKGESGSMVMPMLNRHVLVLMISGFAVAGLEMGQHFLNVLRECLRINFRTKPE